MLYVIGERRVHPGQAHAYIHSAQLIADYWASHARQDSFHMCVAEDDPDRILAIGSWPDRDSFRVAYANIPPDLRAAASAPVAQGTGDWRWYRPTGELRRFADEPEVVAATRFRVQPNEVDRLIEWERGLRARAQRMAGLVILRLLQSADHPGQFIGLGVYGYEAARAAVRQLVAAAPPPVELAERGEFLGRVSFGWTQRGARSIRRAPL